MKNCSPPRHEAPKVPNLFEEVCGGVSFFLEFHGADLERPEDGTVFCRGGGVCLVVEVLWVSQTSFKQGKVFV